MTDITEARSNVQIEETQYRSAVSEATWQKIGGSLNFVNKRQFDTHGFFLNGPYQYGVGGTGLDGLYTFMFDCEIVGATVFNLVTGASSTTTIDLHWLSASGSDQGTIFSTKPSITSAAPNNAYGATNLVDATSQGGTGITLPVFSKTQFNQFDALRLDLDSVMSGAENAGLLIHFRPR